MATVIQFITDQLQRKTEESPSTPRTYSVEVSAYPDSYLEFTANGVKTDAKSLYKIAAELEKIASIIRSDVLTEVVKA